MSINHNYITNLFTPPRYNSYIYMSDIEIINDDNDFNNNTNNEGIDLESEYIYNESVCNNCGNIFNEHDFQCSQCNLLNDQTWVCPNCESCMQDVSDDICQSCGEFRYSNLNNAFSDYFRLNSLLSGNVPLFNIVNDNNIDINDNNINDNNINVNNINVNNINDNNIAGQISDSVGNRYNIVNYRNHNPNNLLNQIISLTNLIERQLSSSSQFIPISMIPIIDFRNIPIEINTLSLPENVKFKVKESEIKKIKTVKKNKIKNEQCSICCENYDDKNNIKLMPCCNADIHENCLRKWFSENYKCPFCRHIYEHERIN